MWLLQIGNIFWFNQQSCYGEEDLSTFKNKTKQRKKTKQQQKKPAKISAAIFDQYLPCTHHALWSVCQISGTLNLT